jgi:tRNA-binding protein
MQIQYEEFLKVEIRVGTVVEAVHLENAHKPAYRMLIDLGDLGIKKSSAQITDHYKSEELAGKRVICVTDVPSKEIAGWESEVLVTGFSDEQGRVVLAVPDLPVPNGSRLY